MDEAQKKQFAGIGVALVVIGYLFFTGEATPETIIAIIVTATMPSAAGSELPKMLTGLIKK